MLAQGKLHHEQCHVPSNGIPHSLELVVKPLAEWAFEIGELHNTHSRRTVANPGTDRGEPLPVLDLRWRCGARTSRIPAIRGELPMGRYTGECDGGRHQGGRGNDVKGLPHRSPRANAD